MLAVGRRSDVRIPPEANVIDASDRTVIPGLIDVHVHVHTPGGPITNYGLAEGRELQGTLALRALAYVWRGLEMGFTTLRSLGSPAYIDVALRDAIAEGMVTGPRLLVAGQGLSVTGGHMDKPLWSPEVTIAGRTAVCDGADSCRQAARAQFKRGVDLIKLNACSEALFHVDPPWGQEMTYEEMAAICEVAHWLHRRVAAHTSGGPGITAAIRAGVDSLEHAHWLSDEQIQLMAERGTFYVPTLAVNSRSIELGAGYDCRQSGGVEVAPQGERGQVGDATASQGGWGQDCRRFGRGIRCRSRRKCPRAGGTGQRWLHPA